MAVFDTDGNGTVSFREFVVGMGLLGSKDQDTDPMSYFAFKLMDADKSGTLSRDELLSIVWQYVKDQEKAGHRAEYERERREGKKLSEYWRDEEEAAAGDARRDYQGASQMPDQNVEKLTKNKGNELQELMAWADDARALVKPTQAELRESAAAKRRRERMQKIRRQMQSAIILLRQEYPPEITPRDFQAVLAKIPEPFAETFSMFQRLKPYMAPCAKVVDAVPALRLDELRAAQSAAIWKEEQKPEWFFDGDGRRRWRQRDERDPDLLEELATMKTRRDMEAASLMMSVGFVAGGGGAQAVLGDASGAHFRVGLDGKQRKKRGPLGPRVAGRSHAAAGNARMRVNELTKIDPKEAAEDLTFVSERARALALNMLPHEEAARIVHVMPPRVRKELYDTLHPRVERLVLETMKINSGWDPAGKVLALVKLAPQGGGHVVGGVGVGGVGGGGQAVDGSGAGEQHGMSAAPGTGWERHRSTFQKGGGGGGGGSVAVKSRGAAADGKVEDDLGRPKIGPDVNPEDLGEVPLSPTARAAQAAMMDPYGPYAMMMMMQYGGGAVGGGGVGGLAAGGGGGGGGGGGFGSVGDVGGDFGSLHPHQQQHGGGGSWGMNATHSGQPQQLQQLQQQQHQTLDINNMHMQQMNMMQPPMEQPHQQQYPLPPGRFPPSPSLQPAHQQPWGGQVGEQPHHHHRHLHA